VDLVVDVIDPGQRNEVVLQAGAEIELGKFDVLSKDVVHLAEMMAVRAHHFHVFGDL